MNRYGVSILQGPAEIKDVDAKQGIVISYPSTFNVVDSGKDRVIKGAFKRTINSWGPEGSKRTKVLFNHEPWSIIGRPLVLREDDFGLYAESKIVPTNVGRDVLLLLENEVITEQSIGYTPVKHEKNEETGVRDLQEVKLYEYSFLAWGMNERTPIVSMKREHVLGDLAVSMKRVERVLQSGEFSTDEVPEMLTRVLAQWQEDVKAMSESESTLVDQLKVHIDVVDVSTPEGIRNAIKSLESLLPPDSPEGTPEDRESTENASDSADSHSGALEKLLTKVKVVNEREDAELTAIQLLREFQRKLATHA